MTFKCHECGECCGPVPMSVDKVAKYKHLIDPYMVVSVGPDICMAFDPRTNKCAFLSPFNKCMIYDDRPTLCKAFGRCDIHGPCPNNTDVELQQISTEENELILKGL